MFKKVGDWDKVEAVIGNLAKEMKSARDTSLKQWGLKAEGTAKKHMSNQDLGWKQLEPSTISQKIRKGYSENILVATSDYFQSINSWSKDAVVYVGVRKTATNRDGQPIADIAAVHEYGSKSGRIPPRPLWRPTYEETMQWFKTSNSRPDVIFMNNIKKYL